uniref:C-type lectin domain-containing protein n=1 Tax=Panagrolaimus davidi TaxID=227884 RepID=A0A914PIS8_9BILA
MECKTEQSSACQKPSVKVKAPQFSVGFVEFGQAKKQFDGNAVTDFWIGLNTLLVLNKWTWTDSTTYDFPEWGGSIPTDILRKCAAFTLHNGYWVPQDCFQKKPYVCEAPLVVTPTSSPLATNCPLGYTFYEPTRSCYGIDHSYQATWQLAETNCINQQGHLASFHTRNETDFISSLNSLTGINLWTGLYYKNNTWEFSDKSNTEYLPWSSGSPHNGSSSNAALISLGTITDVDSGQKYFSVCKKFAT